jgi:hypothetical protein
MGRPLWAQTVVRRLETAPPCDQRQGAGSGSATAPACVVSVSARFSPVVARSSAFADFERQLYQEVFVVRRREGTSRVVELTVLVVAEGLPSAAVMTSAGLWAYPRCRQ